MLAMWLLFITRGISEETSQGCFTNYRPVANIPFLADVIGRFSRFKHIDARRKINKCILCNPPTVNIMLALSAAFDTVDHIILVGRLSGYFGFSHTVLKGFRLILRVAIGHNLLLLVTQRMLEFGVPPGLILGPLLIPLYTAAIPEKISAHNLDCMFYSIILNFTLILILLINVRP